MNLINVKAITFSIYVDITYRINYNEILINGVLNIGIEFVFVDVGNKKTLPFLVLRVENFPFFPSKTCHFADVIYGLSIFFNFLPNNQG